MVAGADVTEDEAIAEIDAPGAAARTIIRTPAPPLPFIEDRINVQALRLFLTFHQ